MRRDDANAPRRRVTRPLYVILGVLAVAGLITALALLLRHPRRHGPPGNTSHTDAAAAVSAAADPTDPGDLVRVQTNNAKIGVLLEELPADALALAVADTMGKSDGWWRTRVLKQFANVFYKLTFLPSFYATRQAIVPPFEEPALDIVFGGPAQRTKVQGHDVIWRPYTLTTYIVGAAGTAQRSDASLAKIGGTFTVPFTLPVDPYLLYQRTGYACADEDQFPHGSLDSEATDVYYDDTCTAGPAVPEGTECIWNNVGCHCSKGSAYSCPAALKQFVGSTSLSLAFTRVAWDEAVAQRMEAANSQQLEPGAQGTNLVAYRPGMAHNWIVYKYFTPASCEALECIRGSGWRKLLIFDAIHTNVGNADLVLGALNYTANEPGSFDQAAMHNQYYWDPCHHHPHFSEYADYYYASTDFGHKQGFCIQTTNRIVNDRRVPIPSTNPNCSYQGIGVGWGDNYNGGIPCQWVDITDEDVSAGPVVADLTMVGNPRNWICEGVRVNNPDGSPQWQFSGDYTTAPPWPAPGLPIDTYRCAKWPAAYADNVDSLAVVDPVMGDGLLTGACPDGDQIFGPKRDCLMPRASDVLSCSAGQNVSMACTNGAARSRVLRVCEASAALRAGLACRYVEDTMLANVVLPPGSSAVTVTFACPAPRDAVETGGLYALYAGDVYPSAALPLAPAPVCTPAA